MLFDDNTVLPDDFDDVVDAPAPSVPTEPPPPEPEPEPEPEPPQFDLELSEPDEWDDLLGDFDEAAPHDDEPEDQEIVAADESTDEPLDMDTQFAIQAEAMGIDLSVASTCAWTSSDEPSYRGESTIWLKLTFEDFSTMLRTSG